MLSSVKNLTVNVEYVVILYTFSEEKVRFYYKNSILKVCLGL